MKVEPTPPVALWSDLFLFLGWGGSKKEKGRFEHPYSWLFLQFLLTLSKQLFDFLNVIDRRHLFDKFAGV